MSPSEFLLVREVAERLRVSRQTVERLLAQGKLRGFKVGRQWRIAEADYRTYIDRKFGG